VTAPGPPEVTGAAAGAAPDRDDGELVRRCQAGDLAAFEPLVEKYRERVWRLAYQILRDREEAWDCAQEAFVRAYQSIGSFRRQSAFYTWLFRITVNVTTDRHRARQARGRAFGTEQVPEEEWARSAADPAAGPAEAAAEQERRARIERALAALPPKARTIIMLSDLEGLTYREIADVLNCPIGTVMSRLHNARKRLRAVLGPMLLALAMIALPFSLLASMASADPQVIRFGIRVLEASNPEVTTPARPGPGAGPPASTLTPPGGLPASGEAEMDERLRRILPRLQALFRYTQYTTIDRQRVEVPLGREHGFPIPGSRRLDVLPDALQGSGVRMRVRLLRGDHAELHTNIVAAPGAPAVLGGPPYGNGVLIIILWANPDPPPR
jgi:RNA polymerase sigma-70 factor (ECF subfamily)